MEEVLLMAEQMPRFPGCEDEPGDDKDRRQCSDKKLLAFIYNNITYPTEARENGVEGTCVIQFVVEKDGSITEAKVVREIGDQLDSEALRVVNLMNTEGIKWIPGMQGGQVVRVQFNLPIRFKVK